MVDAFLVYKSNPPLVWNAGNNIQPYYGSDVSIIVVKFRKYYFLHNIMSLSQHLYAENHLPHMQIRIRHIWKYIFVLYRYDSISPNGLSLGLFAKQIKSHLIAAGCRQIGS